MEVIGSIIKLLFVFIIIEASVITENSSKKYKTESNDQFTNKDIDEYREVFSFIDVDNDGNITNQEFDNIVKLSVEFIIPAQEKYMTRIMTKKFFKDQDADGNGNINFQEFLINSTKCDTDNKNSEMCKIFLILDQDANGYISKDELIASMEEFDKISNEGLAEMFKEFKGQISWPLFSHWTFNQKFTESLCALSNSQLLTSIDKEFCNGVLKTLNTFTGFANSALGLSEAEIVLHNQLWEDQFKKLNLPLKDVTDSTANQTADDKHTMGEQEEVFKFLDKDKDGILNKNDFKDFRSLVKISAKFTPHQRIFFQFSIFQSMINATDSNGDGNVELEEFLANRTKCNFNCEKFKEDTFKIFKIFDENEDGLVSNIELRDTMKDIVKLGKITNAELDEMFKHTDPDSDDYVTFPMFQLWVYNFKFTGALCSDSWSITSKIPSTAEDFCTSILKSSNEAILSAEMAASQTEDQSIIFDKYFEEKLISMGVPIEMAEEDFETTLAPKFD